MSGPTPATVQIPRDVIEPIVREQVVAGVVAALGNPAALIAQVVERALAQKVNYEGKIDSYDYANKYSYIEVVAKLTIHRIVREAIEAWAEERRPEILSEVEKALAKKTNAFAKAMVDGMTNAMTQSWSFKVDIMLPGEKK